VGGALVLVGLVFGVMPVSAPSGASCGSAFISGEWAVGCTRALGAYRTTATVLIVPGVLVLLFANGVRMAATNRARRTA
jgi:hypothetical protein